MKRADNKSRCPVNFSLEVFGDTWSFLIIRDIATDGKSTFNEFLKSEEGIRPSVLSNRLLRLEEKNVIAKSTDSTDRRKIRYSLTEYGLNALPILYEFSVWGTHTSPNPKASSAWYAAMERDRDTVLAAWRKALKQGSSFATGPHSVVKVLGLH